MPSKVYSPEELPTGTSWVTTLNAQDATNQCQVLGISPSTTLAVNRTLLTDFLKTLQLNGGPEPLPVNSRPDLTCAVTTAPAGENTSQATTTTQASSVQPAPSATTTIPSQATPLAGNQQFPTTNSSAPQDTTTQGTDSGRPPSVDWARLVQETAIAVGQQVASAMANSRSPPRATQSKTKVLDDLVRALPVATGAEPRKLAEFLISVARITKLGLFADEDILLAILPRTAEQLRAFWLKGIADRGKLEQVVAGVRDFFLPAQIRHAMVTTMVYRVQQPSESLPEFIDSISDASKILTSHFSERDILDTVLNGLNAPTRAALAAFPAACCLSDLLALVPRVQMVRALEQEQAVSRPETNQRSANSHQNRSSDFTPSNNLIYRRDNQQYSGHNNRNFSRQAYTPHIPQFPFHQDRQQPPRANQQSQQFYSDRQFNSPSQGQGNARGGHR